MDAEEDFGWFEGRDGFGYGDEGLEAWVCATAVGLVGCHFDR